MDRAARSGAILQELGAIVTDGLAAATSIAIGFSRKMCLPARAAATAIASWVECGVATITAPTRASARSAARSA